MEVKEAKEILSNMVNCNTNMEWCNGMCASCKYQFKYKDIDEAALTLMCHIEEVNHGYWDIDCDGNGHCSKCGNIGANENYCSQCGAKMDEQPPVKERHGYWIIEDGHHYQCSVCKRIVVKEFTSYEFCPRCGAKMKPTITVTPRW